MTSILHALCLLACQGYGVGEGSSERLTVQMVVVVT